MYLARCKFSALPGRQGRSHAGKLGRWLIENDEEMGKETTLGDDTAEGILEWISELDAGSSADPSCPQTRPTVVPNPAAASIDPRPPRLVATFSTSAC